MKDPKFKAIYDEVSTELSVAEQIAEMRHKAKMSQKELAKIVHTSRPAIARYESGNYDKYSIATLQRIAKAFHKKLKVSFL